MNVSRTASDIFKVALGVYLSLFLVYGILRIGQKFPATQNIANRLTRYVTPGGV